VTRVKQRATPERSEGVCLLIRCVLLAAVALVAGCASAPQVVVGPDGQSALIVRCPRGNRYRCESRAYQICGRDYQMLDNGNRIGTFVTANGYVVPNTLVFQGFVVFRCPTGH